MPLQKILAFPLGTAQLKMFTSGGTAVLMLPFVNKLYERFGFKPMVILGIFAYCGGFIGYALAPNVPLYLAAGIIQGIGNALCLFVAPTYMVNAWFDKGTSIALLCTTVPASLITSFYNTLGQQFDPDPWVEERHDHRQCDWYYYRRCLLFDLGKPKPGGKRIAAFWL